MGLCMISGFCCEVDENCILLGYYAVSSGNNPQEHSSQCMGLYLNVPPPPPTSAKCSVELSMWQLNFVLRNSIKYKQIYEHHNVLLNHDTL